MNDGFGLLSYYRYIVPFVMQGWSMRIREEAGIGWGHMLDSV